MAGTFVPRERGQQLQHKRWHMKRLAIASLAMLAVSGFTAGPASAVCVPVSAGEPSRWMGGCVTTGTGFAKALFAGARNVGRGLWCIKVVNGEISTWPNDECDGEPELSMNTFILANFRRGPTTAIGADGGFLESGETAKYKGSNEGTFKLKAGSLITVECSTLKSKGTIKGGQPSTAESELALSGCKVAGRSEAECHVESVSAGKGNIKTNALSELVYIGSKAEALDELGKVGDLYSPTLAEKGLFATLAVEGSACPTVKGSHNLEGNFVGEASPSSEVTKSNKVVFPLTAVATAYKWTGAEKITTVEPKLTIYGEKTTLLGTEKTELEAGEINGEKYSAGEEWGAFDS
jgi:hypothetical protein